MSQGSSGLSRQRVWSRLINVVIGLLIGLVVFVIIWFDVTSAIWQEVVILSGLAAGFVTFLLTVLVLDKVLARSTARRWAPVNRLAFTEFLHALADDRHSELSRGLIVPRTLRLPEFDDDHDAYVAGLEDLRQVLLAERSRLADLLGRWSGFLVSSGANETVLLHIADIALSLDVIRDASLEAEVSHVPDSHRDLQRVVDEANLRLTVLATEIQTRLAEPEYAVELERLPAPSTARA